MYRLPSGILILIYGSWLPLAISAKACSGEQLHAFQKKRKAGATYLGEPVVVDGKMITSRRPANLPAFCRAIIRAMQG